MTYADLMIHCRTFRLLRLYCNKFGPSILCSSQNANFSSFTFSIRPIVGFFLASFFFVHSTTSLKAFPSISREFSHGSKMVMSTWKLMSFCFLKIFSRTWGDFRLLSNSRSIKRLDKTLALLWEYDKPSPLLCEATVILKVWKFQKL